MGVTSEKEVRERGRVILGEVVVLEPNFHPFLALLSHSFNTNE